MFMFEDHATREGGARRCSRSLPKFGSDVVGTSALQRGALLEGKGAWLLHVQSAWVHGKISNLQYLLYLNFAAGRSFNTLAQWPVFPWVAGRLYVSGARLGEAEARSAISASPWARWGHPQRLEEARCVVHIWLASCLALLYACACDICLLRLQRRSCDGVQLRPRMHWEFLHL